MKTLFTFLTLPVIALLYFFSGKCYVATEYVASFSLMLGCFATTIAWIYQVSGRMQKQQA